MPPTTCPWGLKDALEGLVSQIFSVCKFSKPSAMSAFPSDEEASGRKTETLSWKVGEWGDTDDAHRQALCLGLCMGREMASLLFPDCHTVLLWSSTSNIPAVLWLLLGVPGRCRWSSHIAPEVRRVEAFLGSPNDVTTGVSSSRSHEIVLLYHFYFLLPSSSDYHLTCPMSYFFIIITFWKREMAAYKSQ